MEILGKEDRRELDWLTVVVNFGFQKGWITENQKLQIEKPRMLNQKNAALFEMLKIMKCDKNAARFLCAIRCINEFKPSNINEIDEDHFLSVIMSKLFENSLVTLEEKLAFETEVNDRNALKNPMRLRPVIKCVLEYLDIKEIKNSRYISKEWSRVALSALTTRSKITFSQTTEADKGPLKFFQVFPDTVEEIIPFSAFTITGSEKNPWGIDELEYFFRNQGKYIRELALGKLYLADKYWQKIDRLDITPWISNSPMTKSKQKYYTSFSVSEENDLEENEHEENPTELSVDLSALVSVKALELDDCQINLQDGIRISPVTLESLSNVTFFKDGNKLTELCVNDIVDFSKLNSITLGCDRDQDVNEATKLPLVLDENEELKIDYLCAQRIGIKSWKTCKWTVKLLILEKVPFIEKTEMRIKKLNLIESDIELSVLPQQSLEKLFIEQVNDGTCVCSQPVVLVDVKALHLDLKVGADSFSTFYQNVKCPNLVYLTLIVSPNFSVDLAWIPKTVKYLSLSGVDITNEENKTLNVKILYLNDYDPGDLNAICGTTIRAKELYLYRDLAIRLDSFFIDFLEYQKGAADIGQRIYLGPCDWTAHSFELSPMRANVDKESEYYVFVTNMGKAIESDEFEKQMEKSWPDYCKV